MLYVKRQEMFLSSGYLQIKLHVTLTLAIAIMLAPQQHIIHYLLVWGHVTEGESGNVSEYS